VRLRQAGSRGSGDRLVRLRQAGSQGSDGLVRFRQARSRGNDDRLVRRGDEAAVRHRLVRRSQAGCLRHCLVRRRVEKYRDRSSHGGVRRLTAYQPAIAASGAQPPSQATPA
jgi:hypothetical protein